jgi:hypothetical protein
LDGGARDETKRLGGFGDRHFSSRVEREVLWELRRLDNVVGSAQDLNCAGFESCRAALVSAVV